MTEWSEWIEIDGSAPDLQRLAKHPREFQIKFKDGDVYKATIPEMRSFRWKHIGTPCDIIAYRTKDREEPEASKVTYGYTVSDRTLKDAMPGELVRWEHDLENSHYEVISITKSCAVVKSSSTGREYTVDRVHSGANVVTICEKNTTKYYNLYASGGISQGHDNPEDDSLSATRTATIEVKFTNGIPVSVDLQLNQ